MRESDLSGEDISGIAHLAGAPAPTTVRELAASFEEACVRALESDDADPVVQPLRGLLTADDGPFALTETIETRYPNETSAELKEKRAKTAALEAALPDVPRDDGRLRPDARRRPPPHPRQSFDAVRRHPTPAAARLHPDAARHRRRNQPDGSNWPTGWRARNIRSRRG